MTVQDTKTRVVSRIWQSVAQSGVSLSAIPEDQQQALVNAIADGVLLAVDEALDEAGLPVRQQFAAVAGGEEKILWEGRPFLSLITHYQITTERVRIFHGLLGKDRDDIELVRIQDLDIQQGLGERIMDLGDVVIQSSDPSTPTAELNNVSSPQEVHEILRRAMLDARRRFRYTVQEEM